MINIDATSTVPIYEQIYNGIVKLIFAKVLKPNEQLPSIRELATMLKINPNTIQKSYKLLEIENYIYTIKGKGNFVKNTEELQKAHMYKIKNEMTSIITKLKNIGLTDENIVGLVKEILSYDGGDKLC